MFFCPLTYYANENASFLLNSTKTVVNGFRRVSGVVIYQIDNKKHKTAPLAILT